jgi:hypothetical protein
MKIEDLRLENNDDRCRVTATVVWEDCDRPKQDVYFETLREFAEGLSCNPYAFLIGCLLPAMHDGEERILLDAETCPELNVGLLKVMKWIRHWYGPERKLVRIEMKKRTNDDCPKHQRNAGFFFSGGIDSLATLCSNRLDFPISHPGSIKDGLLVYGLEIYQPEKFEPVLKSLSTIAADTGITLIPVYTNIRYLNDDWKFWRFEFQGAVFSAIAHAFSRRLNLAYIASTNDIPNMRPFGSHPLIDPNYSSTCLRMSHHGITLSRLDKTKLVAGCHVALQNLRVCNKIEYYEEGSLNCGQCEKCVRTMLALLAIGKLDKIRSFPVDNVTEELCHEAVELRRMTFPHYHELLEPLEQRGRQDLVRIIESKISHYHKPEWRKNWKQKAARPILDFDTKYLNGSLRRLKKRLSP